MLSVILPTYEERENLAVLLPRLGEVGAQLGEPLEALVVDGGSQDGTAAYARELVGRVVPGRVIEHTEGGLMQAVREGIQAATGDLIAVMDADASHPPELLPVLVRAVRSGAQVAIASRYVPGGRIVGWPWSRRILSRLGTLLARPLVDVADATSGYFVVEARFVKPLTLRADGFKVLLQLLAEAPITRVHEVPYEFRNRLAGSSKLSPQVLWAYARQLARLYARLGRGAGSRGLLRSLTPSDG